MDRDEIKDRLEKNKLTFVWLIQQLEKRGIYTDKSEMSGVFAGTRRGPKPERIIRESAAILDEYESIYQCH